MSPAEAAGSLGWFIDLFTHNFHTSLKITILTAFGIDTERQLHLTVHKSNSLCTQFSQAAESIWVCQDFIPKSINVQPFPSPPSPQPPLSMVSVLQKKMPE
jgi:hypothetical protein